jgi:hypothetical protein
VACPIRCKEGQNKIAESFSIAGLRAKIPKCNPDKYEEDLLVTTTQLPVSALIPCIRNEAN